MVIYLFYHLDEALFSEGVSIYMKVLTLKAIPFIKWN